MADGQADLEVKRGDPLEQPSPIPRRFRPRNARSIVACAAIAALLGIIPVFVDTALGYVPLVAFVVLIALDVAYLMVLKGRIGFSGEQIASSCTRGEALRFPLALENRAWLPALRIDALFYISDIFQDGGRFQTRQVTMAPHSDNVFDLGVRFDHLGIVEVGIRQITVFDPLCLFGSARENVGLARVHILPRVVDLASLQISDYSLKESQTNVKTYISDGMDYAGIREYRWGDPMKAVHWKLSSKLLDDYFTRLYEQPTMPGVAVFLDLECDGGDAERLMDVYDAVVESALSVERYAAGAGYDTEVLFVDDQGAYQRIEGPLENRYAKFMRHLPRIAPGQGRALLGLLEAESRSQTCQNNLVVCSANLTDGLVALLRQIEDPTRRPLLIAVVDRADDGPAAEMRKRLDAARIAYLCVSSADDLKAKVG